MSAHFTPLARSLPASIPFVGPEALERRLGFRFSARLGANESVFGPSPHAVEAMRKAAAQSWMYGDPEHFELREAIAAHLGTPVETVTVGEGIDGLLGHLVRLACAPGDLVVTSLGAYPTFNYHVAGHGGLLDFVPYRDDHEDIDALIERANALRPKLLYFANPDNPTGSVHSAAEVERLVAAMPEETILVLDEAYSDMAPDALPPIGLVRPNLLRFRTFSKAYGLAGARVGYAIGHRDLVSGFDRVRNHFGLSRISQAGALAALEDQAHLTRVLGEISAARDRIAAIAVKARLRPLPSATNFVAIDCGGDGARARAILEAIIARRVFIRMPGVAPLDRTIRVTAGPDGDLDLFEAALAGALDEVGAPD